MKTIIVTGGAGFIGSHLCDALLKYKNTKVICIDNLFTGRIQNIRHLLNNPRFKFINHDIVNPIFFDDEIIDQIYHLACPAAPIHYQINPIRTIKANVIGTTNMLGIAKKHRARILLTSTSEVYGDPIEHPQTEQYRGNVNPIGPRACYDEGKRCAETMMFDYHRQHSVDIRVARIFNTYGPRMTLNDGRVVSNFIIQALRKQNITIYGDGKHTRSFCYVSDTVNGLIKLMQKNNFTGPVNIGNPHELTIREIAEKIKKMTKTKSEIVYEKLPEDDPKKRQPDISLAKKELGWKPKIKLEEGLKNTISYFKKEINNYS